MINYRELIRTQNNYIEENDWWQINKGCKIGSYLENIERINVREAAKAYRIQLKKFKKNKRRLDIIFWRRLAFIDKDNMLEVRDNGDIFNDTDDARDFYYESIPYSLDWKWYRQEIGKTKK